MTVFECDYRSVWSEEQNVGALAMLRDKLGSGEAVILVLQPGDGTRYRMLLVPEPAQVGVSDNGREPEARASSNVLLMATVLGELGSGTAYLRREYTIDDVRFYLENDLVLRNDNRCTLEALTHAVHAVWCDPS